MMASYYHLKRIEAITSKSICIVNYRYMFIAWNSVLAFCKLLYFLRLINLLGSVLFFIISLLLF